MLGKLDPSACFRSSPFQRLQVLTPRTKLRSPTYFIAPTRRGRKAANIAMESNWEAAITKPSAVIGDDSASFITKVAPNAVAEARAERKASSTAYTGQGETRATSCLFKTPRAPVR